MLPRIKTAEGVPVAEVFKKEAGSPGSPSGPSWAEKTAWGLPVEGISKSRAIREAGRTNKRNAAVKQTRKNEAKVLLFHIIMPSSLLLYGS